MTKKTYALPLLIVGPADINRTLIELRQVHEQMDQLSLSSMTPPELPVVTPALAALAEANNANLLHKGDREHLTAFLESLQQHAPILHISFASEPSSEFLGKILDWLRQNISRYVLVQVGLQPSIAAGCIVRSTSRVFDMSLRQHLQKNKMKMVEIFHQIRERDEATAAAAEQKQEQPA